MQGEEELNSNWENQNKLSFELFWEEQMQFGTQESGMNEYFDQNEQVLQGHRRRGVWCIF